MTITYTSNKWILVEYDWDLMTVMNHVEICKTDFMGQAAQACRMTNADLKPIKWHM